MSRISPEKSRFAQTCNLLSHYVKEKGSLRDLNIDINGGTEVKNGQMTIIYAGQVLVFDDFSAVKANEVMQLASKYVNASKVVENPSNSMAFASSMGSISGSVEAQNEIKQQAQPIWLDLPIARRASLHRFLSKRKDRASSRGPYQLHKPSAESPKELFDLNL
ncbi:hypothetical protein DCAR_0623496 [Daucus carota subsp. sativus]|uniref:Tify domain-containing protein n=1 Tax=Daucus carota subsp. sativus TaxID=79200 RepID=A0AAF0XA89_DAUCS|nr:hypothetical protein DCAR_0623496 [Daucus carota subsp. sativus]